VPAATHHVFVGDKEVIKRFRSWQRGEPDREWRGLELLQTYAPGLAPKPLARWTDGERPVIVMSRLSGETLGAQPLSDDQVSAVATALTRLHSAVPGVELAKLPRRLWGAVAAVGQLRTHGPPPHGISDDLRLAYPAGMEWIGSADATRFAEADAPLVFGHADGNIANIIWNEGGCGLVDFEDSGASDIAFEIADLIEHPATSLAGVLDADALLGHLRLDKLSKHRLRQARKLMAVFWLIMLLPGGRSHERNPEGSVERQAQRVMELLG